jgi:hypothetical protein
MRTRPLERVLSAVDMSVGSAGNSVGRSWEALLRVCLDGGIEAPTVRRRFTLEMLAEARLRARTHIFRPDPCEACEVRTRLRL